MAATLMLNLRTLRKDVKAHLYATQVVPKYADRKVIPTVSLRTKRIVQSTVNTALHNISDVMKSGVEGAESGISSLAIADGRGFHRLRLHSPWPRLNEEYARRKESENRGAGVFHLYRGRLKRSYAGAGVPSVSARHFLASERPVGRGDNLEIRFNVNIGVGPMVYPFDELVRRPLILGRKGLVDPKSVPFIRKEKRRAIWLILEGGAVRRRGKTPSVQPPRPFLGAMSVYLNAQMRSRILQQDSKE